MPGNRFYDRKRRIKYAEEPRNKKEELWFGVEDSIVCLFEGQKSQQPSVNKFAAVTILAGVSEA